MTTYRNASAGNAPRVVSTVYLPPDILAPLAGVPILLPPGPDAPPLSRAETIAALPEAEAVLTASDLRVDAELLAHAPRLRIAANIARGYDNLDLDAMSARGVWATNVPDAFTIPTAEVAFGLLLMVARRLAEGDRHVRAGEWARFEPGRWDGVGLAGKTLGLVGLGKIGAAMAARAAAFEMRVVYTRRTPAPDAPFPWLPLPDLLAASDVVSLHVPATPETHHLMDAGAFGRMKPGAILVNTARGSVVDEAALVAALVSGHLGGAGLDVAEREPRLPPELLTLPNVTVTPHLGGGTTESRRESRSHAVANVAAVLRGAGPLAPLNADGLVRRTGGGA